MDLDLEADLGIDTVKQAEVFASIREAYGIERDDALKLRDYPTLNHVVGFVRERAGIAEPAPVAEPEPVAVDPEPVAAPEPVGELEPVGEPDPVAAPEPVATEPATPDPRFPRRVPAPVVRPPLDCCVETGVAIGKGSRILVMPDATGVAAALEAKLVELGAEVLTIADSDTAEQQLERIDGVYWLPALDPDGDLGDANVRTEALDKRVKLAATVMRAIAPDAFFISGTRLGGRHGYGSDGATSVLGGAVTGFTKALARERADATVKTVDFDLHADASTIASALLEETLSDPGAVEIGYADELRWTIGLVERDPSGDAGPTLGADTSFVITGAAGSIVSAITVDLANAAKGGVFHLLDLVPEPEATDPELIKFTTDRDGLKRDIAERLKEQGERPTPKLIERELARLERARAALDAIEAIERIGGNARWHQLDLTDQKQVQQVVRNVLEQSPRVDVLMHCAGIEISHFLPDKPQREYDLVFDVKAHGWLNLLAALADANVHPGTAVVFSSIAGRFGNAGQTDYSAANDLLCKSVSHLRREGRTRGIAIDWTAWAEIGMASRGSIPKVMQAAGIDMLPPAVGVTAVRRELTAPGAGTEVVVAGSLGLLLAERHPTGGVDPLKATAALLERGGPMCGRIEALSAAGQLTVVTELDPAEQAFLNHHRIDGTAVLPGVMGMEGFAEAASSLLPGYQPVELEQVDLLAPFKFYRDEPRTLILHAMLRDGGDGTILADCELIGRRTLTGQGEQETRHFAGRARLARRAPAAPRTSAPSPVSYGVGHDDVYRVYFHGPAYQVLDRAWRSNGDIVGQLCGELPADHEPQSKPTLISPRLIELCFQTAGVWELGTAGRMALPTHVDRMIRYAGAMNPGTLWAVVHPRGGSVDAEVVDEDGCVKLRLEGYRTIELPGAVEADALEPIRDAMKDGR